MSIVGHQCAGSTWYYCEQVVVEEMVWLGMKETPAMLDGEISDASGDVHCRERECWLYEANSGCR